jgi:hypothetical protein
MIVWPAPRPSPPAGGTEGTVPVFIVAPTEDAEFPGLNPLDRRAEGMLAGAGDASTFSVAGYRFEMDRVAARATLLFPFLTPGLALEHFGTAADRSPVEKLINPFAAAFAQKAPTAGKPPLALSDAALQGVVDSCWSRRDRWTPFQRIIKLADASDPDVGALPDLLRAYADQDGLQPYADASVRDPRLWTQLGLAADHVGFIGFIRRFTSEHPGTKAATELLFLLDQLAQGSADALVGVLSLDPERDLKATRRANPAAFELVWRVRDHFGLELQRRGLVSIEDTARHFDAIRVEILSLILHTTPNRYRASDARYLIGAILWRQGRWEEASAVWNGISIDASDRYVTAYTEILEALGRTPLPEASGARTALAVRIGQILAAEHGRWIDFSYGRLKTFGYHFNTY